MIPSDPHTLSSETLSKIADRLSAPIPCPASPKPKPKSSWRTLKPGQTLRLKTAWFRGGKFVPPGTTLRVHSVDSMGADLEILSPLKNSLKPMESSPELLTQVTDLSILERVRWTTPEWQTTFERVRKVRRKKCPNSQST